jgi:hypothetical protein
VIQYLVLLGAVVSLIGISAYIKDTLRGKTKPNRVTWVLWSIAPLIATVAAISDGVRWAVLPVFMTGFGPLLVLIASFVNKKSYWKITKLDYFCGLLSVLALVFWAITKDPVIAIIFSIASDGFAALPTLIKSWKFPETETGIAYLVTIFSASTSFAAIKIWTFSAYGFAVYTIIINILFSLFIYRKRLIK